MKESQTYHGFTDSAVSGGGYQVSCHFVNLVNSVMSRNHVCINADQLKMTMIPIYFRGVLSQQGRFIRRGSSRRQRKTSLIGSRLRMQCAGTTCLPLKEENTPGSEVVATLVHLPALSPHRTLPQARWVVSPTPFQGICPRLSFPSYFVQGDFFNWTSPENVSRLRPPTNLLGLTPPKLCKCWNRIHFARHVFQS